MKKVEKVSTFAAHSVTGPEGLREVVRGADVAVTQLRPGAFEGMLFAADLGPVTLSGGASAVDMRLRGVMVPGQVTLATLLDQTGQASLWGHECLSGDVLVFPPSGEQDGCYRGMTSYVALLMRMDDLLQAALPYGAVADPALWDSCARHQTPAPISHALRCKLRGCVAMLQLSGSATSERMRAHAREEMLEAFFTAMGRPAERSTPQPFINSARIVRQVEDHLVESGMPSPHVTELCHALGLSRRTLHRAFHSVLGIGPKAYLRLRSLSAARLALVQPGGPQSVTQVALDHGFLELGRFSVTYRRMFGESPSQTLQRAQQAGGLGRAPPEGIDWHRFLLQGFPPR